MPTQITHLVHGQQFLRLRPDLDAGAFLRGVVFPDIRYLAKLDRSQTHQPHAYSLKMIMTEQNAWRAGTMFHNWTDDTWTGFMTRYGLEEGDSDHAYKWATLKLLQDKYTIDFLENRDWLAATLPVSDPEATAMGVTAEQVDQWNELIAAEVRDGWMAPTWDEFARVGLHLTAAQIQEVRNHLAQLDHEGIWWPRLEECWSYVSGAVAGG